MFFSIMPYHRMLNIVPCAIRWDRAFYPFYMYSFASANPKLPLYPSSSPCVPLKPQVCSLWVSFCFIDRCVFIIFDSTYEGQHMVFVSLFLFTHTKAQPPNNTTTHRYSITGGSWALLQNHQIPSDQNTKDLWAEHCCQGRVTVQFQGHTSAVLTWFRQRRCTNIFLYPCGSESNLPFSGTEVSEARVRLPESSTKCKWRKLLFDASQKEGPEGLESSSI